MVFATMRSRNLSQSFLESEGKGSGVCLLQAQAGEIKILFSSFSDKIRYEPVQHQSVLDCADGPALLKPIKGRRYF